MNESSRQERIIRTSVIGILVNLLIAAVKIMIGTLASSIAIVSEGINNATDAGCLRSLWKESFIRQI